MDGCICMNIHVNVCSYTYIYYYIDKHITGHVSASIFRQFQLREELSSYNNKFQAFQNR
jgi:hypothetical protein